MFSNQGWLSGIVEPTSSFMFDVNGMVTVQVSTFTTTQGKLGSPPAPARPERPVTKNVIVRANALNCRQRLMVCSPRSYWSVCEGVNSWDLTRPAGESPARFVPRCGPEAPR